MIKILQGKGPLSYKAIAEEFARYNESRDKLNLLLLTVSDYSENGFPYFDEDNFERNFDERTKDILWRYHGKAMQEGKIPSLIYN